MLDDSNVLKQRDPSGALGVAAEQYTQVQYAAEVINQEHDGRAIQRVVVAGMGGSALAAAIVKAWLKKDLTVPFEVVRSYDLPEYVDHTTLVIASSHSGNTEETLSALEEARQKNAQIAIIASGGKLSEAAKTGDIVHVLIPGHMQPRMAVIYNLRALLKLLAHFNVVSEVFFDEIAKTADWLHEKTKQWEASVTVDKNYAKQLALLAVGKT